MQKEIMSVHRGLAELSLLDDKIAKAVNNGVFCKYNKRSNQKIDGMSIDDFKSKVIIADYDKVKSYLDRRQKIKSAVVKSNAITEIEIVGNKMTIAEAIDRKNSINNDKMFLNMLKNQYSHALCEIEENNSRLTERADHQINMLYQNKENVDPVKIQSLREDFINENTYDLIDAINIKEKIESLEKEIEEFELEVDFKLSESNSLTMIEI